MHSKKLVNPNPNPNKLVIMIYGSHALMVNSLQSQHSNVANVVDILRSAVSLILNVNSAQSNASGTKMDIFAMALVLRHGIEGPMLSKLILIVIRSNCSL